MHYEDIWAKTLSSDERVEYEFSIGSRYQTVWLTVWGALSALLLIAGGLGVLTFVAALFYYKFYSRVANAYAFTNKRVLIHRGWLSTHTTSIDYAMITDVQVGEPFLERLITRTGNLSINTAGSSMREVVLTHVAAPYEIKKRLDALKDR